MDLELEGKRALVTGGSRGIGKAIAHQLAAEGADVVIAARTTSTLEEAAKEIAAASRRRIVPVTVDTTDGARVAAMVDEAVAALGGLDILVNCAARPASQSPGSTYELVTEEDFLDDMNTKVMGYLRVAQRVAPLLVENGWGRIINISGMAARRTGPIVGSMRNAAVIALTKNLADSLSGTGVNVTVVCPGTTRTEVTTPEREAAASPVAIGRMVDSEEVAYVVAFLASPKSVAIDGDSIAAGGGEPRSIYY